MNRERFDSLVAYLEDYAAKHPTRYLLRVGLLAVLGYAYLLIIVAALLLVIFAVVMTGRINFLVIKLLWIPLLLVAAVGRALWVKFPAPEGHELKSDEAPRLFELAGEVRQRLAAPTLHTVLVTDDFNAAVVQRPRLGVFGWQQNYLIVGLPLMHALSRAQFRSVVAHEFGHLSGNHGRFGGWVYRVRQTWDQLLTRLQAEGRRGSFVFERFLNWYAPFFNAYTFVLARRQEYEADACAVEVAGRNAAAEALASIAVKAKFLDESYWQSVFKRADVNPAPPNEAFAGMFAALKHDAVTDANAQTWFKRSLLEQTSSVDTHPSLAARLAAMGYEGSEAAELQHQLPHIFSPIGESAADYYLGEAGANLTTEMNRTWREQVQTAWRERHKYVCEAREQLDALEAKRRTVELDDAELWTQIRLIVEMENAAAAEPAARELLVREAQHAGANFLVGQAMLARDDEAGIAHLERAMNNDYQTVFAGCELLHDFYTGRGQTEDVERIQRRGREHYERLEAARSERQTFEPSDALEPHDLNDAQVENLRDGIRDFADVCTAYLARKTVAQLPEVPCYVLAVITEKRWYNFRAQNANNELIQSLVNGLEFPGETFVIVLEDKYKPLRRSLKQIAGAQIFPRE